jgi:hypothetical protein
MKNLPMWLRLVIVCLLCVTLVGLLVSIFS